MSSMTDRELLEAAAKAAGPEHVIAGLEKIVDGWVKDRESQA